MTSDRPYRRALGLDAALEDCGASPHAFDPRVVAAVIGVQAAIAVGAGG